MKRPQVGALVPVPTRRKRRSGTTRAGKPRELPARAVHHLAGTVGTRAGSRFGGNKRALHRPNSSRFPPPSPPAEEATASQGDPAAAAHSMRASAQVTAPGAVTSMIVAVSTRPNRENKSTCSRMSVSLVTNSPGRILRPNRLRYVNCLALPIIIISIKTIKDLYIATFADRAFPPGGNPPGGVRESFAITRTPPEQEKGGVSGTLTGAGF
jgi:hypothetical protein